MNDDTAELQAAIDRAANPPWWKRLWRWLTNGNFVVFIPPGEYFIAAPLSLPRHVELRCRK